MSKILFLAAALVATSPAFAQQSLQTLHTNVPSPPANSAAAVTWLTSPAVSTLRKQLKDQRAFVEKLSKDAAAESMPGAAPSGGGIDFARAQRDPAYAQEIQKKIASMSQAEQMQLATQMSQAMQQQAVQDVKKMAADPPAVQAAAARYSDYQGKTMLGSGILAQQQAVSELQQQARDKATAIAAAAENKLKCGDGEGSCSAADQAADKATLRAAHAQIIAEYDRALAAISQQVAAARKSRAADIAAAQKDLGPAGYGAAAQSSANKQLVAAYHNAVLVEIEQLFMLSEESAKWAATRYQDRTINFMPID
jgi:hypothetical protein